MLPFVRFVEKNRGLEFDHPVDVRLVPKERFDAMNAFDVSGDPWYRGYIGLLQSLGLLSATDDGTALDEDAPLLYGFYNPFGEKVVVRGDDLRDPETRVVLVHELVHALVDQSFQRLDASDGAGGFAFQALTEGDATAVELDYTDTLPARERVEVAELSARVTKELSVLEVIGGTPYVLGAAYVDFLESLDGRNAAFRDAPVEEDEVIDPLRGESAVGRIERLPKLASDERRRPASATIGQLLVFLTLASRLDLATSLRATIGWGGDRATGFRHDGVDCTRFAVRGADRAETAELSAAFQAWAAAGTPGASGVLDRDDDVLVVACESDEPVEPAEDLAEAVSLVLGGRLYWSSRSLDDGQAPLVARCVGNAMSVDPQVLAAERAAGTAGRWYRDLDAVGDLVTRDRLTAVTAQCLAASPGQRDT